MRNNRFQNLISESSITLPLCMVIGTLVWFWNGNILSFEYSLSGTTALIMAIITTYVVMETANTYSLLRIRSRMIATVWVVGISLMTFTHTFSEGWVAALTLAGSYYVMFMAYQQHQPVVHVFHTFALLGIALLAVPQLLVLVPLYYWYLLVFLRALTWRGFWGGIVGLALPMCFTIGWSIIRGDFHFIYGRIENLLATGLFVKDDYTWMLDYKNPETLAFAFISLLSLVGIVHYLRNYYNDKIRTRMYLYIYVMQTIACWLIIICSPDMYHLLAPSLMLGASTMIAHFFALTGSVISNLFFYLTLAATLSLFVLNLGIWNF